MVVRRRRTEEESEPVRRRPATTPEARENQLIAAAADLAEKQLLNGTASAQVITHYLKLGSSREKLEQERLGLENNLLQVKAEAIASAQRVEALYHEALNAMRSYAGQEPMEMDEGGDYED
jgi:hypothetical protein